nr:DUF4142 domain-containing protein [uncultured Brevundimonas sp.]
MKTAIIAAAAAAALLSACSSMPTGAAAPIAAAAVDQAAPAAMDYVRMAGASDLYEINSSQVLLQTSQNEELRRFAQMMIDHHTQTTATVKRAAETVGMTPPPPALDARKADMIRQLQQAQGQARDTLYIQQQVMAHQEALTLHASYARNGDEPALKAAATSAVPIVSQHYNEISAMQGGASM